MKKGLLSGLMARVNTAQAATPIPLNYTQAPATCYFVFDSQQSSMEAETRMHQGRYSFPIIDSDRILDRLAGLEQVIRPECLMTYF